MNSIGDAELAHTLTHGNTTSATKYAPYAQETQEEQRSKESEKQISCWKMVSHLTWVCTLEMRGGFSPEFHLPLSCFHDCQNQTHRLSGSLFHCKGKLRVCTLLRLDNTESAGREARSFQGFNLIWVLSHYWTSHSWTTATTSCIIWSLAF